MKLEQLNRALLKVTDMYWQATGQAINLNNITFEDVAREIRAIEEQLPDFGIMYLGRRGFGLYPREQEGCLNTVEEWAEALSSYADDPLLQIGRK